MKVVTTQVATINDRSVLALSDGTMKLGVRLADDKWDYFDVVTSNPTGVFELVTQEKPSSQVVSPSASKRVGGRVGRIHKLIKDNYDSRDGITIREIMGHCEYPEARVRMDVYKLFSNGLLTRTRDYEARGMPYSYFPV